MPYSETYLTQAPAREAIDQSHGAVLLEFGTPWCGHCARAAPLVRAALTSYPELPHVRVQDGPGQRLGRSFGVKLWPTLVFLRDGAEVARLVRPQTEGAIADALAQIGAQSSPNAAPGNSTSV